MLEAEYVLIAAAIRGDFVFLAVAVQIDDAFLPYMYEKLVPPKTLWRGSSRSVTPTASAVSCVSIIKPRTPVRLSA